MQICWQIKVAVMNSHARDWPRNWASRNDHDEEEVLCVVWSADRERGQAEAKCGIGRSAVELPHGTPGPQATLKQDGRQGSRARLGTDSWGSASECWHIWSHVTVFETYLDSKLHCCWRSFTSQRNVIPFPRWPLARAVRGVTELPCFSLNWSLKYCAFCADNVVHPFVHCYVLICHLPSC